MVTPARLDAQATADLFWNSHKEFIEEITKNYVEERRAFLRTYISNPRPFLPQATHELVMAELRLELGEIVQNAFDSLSKALKAGETGAFISCVRCFETKNPKNHPLYRELTKKVFSDMLGIKTDFVDEKPFGQDTDELLFPGETEVPNAVTYCVASWNEKQDPTLRSLLGIEDIPEPTLEMQRLNAKRQKGENTDVTFVVAGTTFHAHKAVITKNEYFSLLLEGAFKERALKDDPYASIPIEDTKPELFEAVLTYLYTGTVSLSGKPLDFLIDLALLADKMFIEDLKKLSNIQTKLSLSPKNFFPIALHACNTNDQDLLTACAFFLRKTPTILTSLDRTNIDDKFYNDVCARILEKIVLIIPPPSDPKLELQKFYLLK